MSDINPEHPEVFSFLQNRRSVPAKTMSGPGPSETEIEELIKIASRVPDHGKLSPWRFVRYSESYCRKLNAAIATRFVELNPDANSEAIEIESNRMTRVPVVISILSAPVDHPKIPIWEQELSAGAVAMNMLLGANSLGYDAQWLTEWIAFDESLAGPLGVKTGERIAGIMHIGTKTMPKTERARPELNDIYTTLNT